MIPNQHLPVLAAALHLSTHPLLPALKSDHGLAAPIRVRSRVDRILQHAQHRVIPSRSPDDLLRLFWAPRDGQLNLLPIQPEEHLSHAAHLRKFAEDQINGGPDPGIGILLDAVLGSFDISNRNPSHQGTPLRLLQNRRLCALAEARHFHLANRALHA